MKPVLYSTVVWLAMCLAGRAVAQQIKASDSGGQPNLAGPGQAASDRSKASAEELEAKFKATLTNATLSGRWCSIKDGVLGPEKEDKYSIVSITRVSGDDWIIKARIQYNQVDIVAPIPIKVKWAGDTPVLVLDNIPIPGAGAYSARVLIYEHTYAGTWSGRDHGGLLNGVITNEKHP